MNDLEYQQEFDAFLKDYHGKEMDPEEMGAFIMRLAQIFAAINMRVVAAERELALVARDIENRTDGAGKAITSAKAKTFIDATDEGDRYNTLKAHRENVEQFISAVRALQKGALQEWNHLAST
jgi:hypothetical protein